MERDRRREGVLDKPVEARSRERAAQTYEARHGAAHIPECTGAYQEDAGRVGHGQS